MYNENLDNLRLTHFNFPIPLLERIHTNLFNGLNDIFDIGIYNLSISVYGNVDFKTYKMTLEILKYKFPNPEKSFKNATEINKLYGTKTPIVGISIKVIWDYYKNPKTEFQIMVLCCFCAIRSILGKKRFIKTNNKLIIERMFGYCKTNPKPIHINDNFIKYSQRYHIDKLKKELECNWHLKNYSNYVRGFYLSFTASYLELAKHNEINKKKSKLTQLKNAKNEAKKEAIKELEYNLNTSNNR